MKEIEIDNLRKAMGTLPHRDSEIVYDYANALKSCTVKLIDIPKNPYKNIVAMAVATWGSGKMGEDEGSCGKWKKLTPENRFKIVVSALKGKTLPTCLESIKFLFEFNGIPRHTFDQFARLRIGAGIASIGCRDNSKLDAPFILYPELDEMLEKDTSFKKMFESWMKETKDLYAKILSTSKGSYQVARTVLPMCYNHSWVCTINYKALKEQCLRRMMACEEAPIVLIFWKMREEIKKLSPLLANYLRPLCDITKKCVYAGGAEDLSKLFSCLFKGCGRYPAEHEYAEFNLSCSSYNEISKYVEIVTPDGWTEYGINDFDKLSETDKKLFREE